MAYERATARLREAHADEFHALHNEERQKLGLKPKPSAEERKAARIKKIEAELAQLQDN